MRSSALASCPDKPVGAQRSLRRHLESSCIGLTADTKLSGVPFWRHYHEKSRSMRACRQLISVLHRMFRVRTGIHSQLAEEWMQGHDTQSPLKRDEECSESAVYHELLSPPCSAEVEAMYRAAMTQLRMATLEQSADALNALMFLQEVVATALWKFNCAVSKELEGFARSYDRLDTHEDRKRLHSEARS